MKNFFTNMKLLLGFNEKLYNMALDYYLQDVKPTDAALDKLYDLILERLVYPVGQKDAYRLMAANYRDVNSKFWMFKSHPIEELNAQVQEHQNKGVLLELKSLHRSEKYMFDFLRDNALRVETDPFGNDELVSDDNLDEREVLFSPIMLLCQKGKKAIKKRFEGSSTPPEKS